MKNTTASIPTILLKKVIHRDKIQLLLLFPYNNEIKNSLYKIGGYYWSKTLRGWYTEFTLKNIELLKQALNDKVTFVMDSSVQNKLGVIPKEKKQKISDEKKQIMNLFVKHLKAQKHTESTIKMHVTFFADFFDYLKDTPITKISNATIEQFMEAVLVPRDDSESAYSQFSSTIKLFKVFYPECTFKELPSKELDL